MEWCAEQRVEHRTNLIRRKKNKEQKERENKTKEQ